MEKYLRELRGEKPIVEQKRKNTSDVMRRGKSQHIGERAKGTNDNKYVLTCMLFPIFYFSFIYGPESLTKLFLSNKSV